MIKDIRSYTVNVYLYKNKQVKVRPMKIYKNNGSKR